MITRKDIRKLGPYLYEIPQNFREDMRVPARIYADETILEASLNDKSLIQLVNTATLPGIVGYALAMPDIHQGYGFPIGGVAATRVSDGVVSPGGVGYDINCLAETTAILHEHGYTLRIEEMEEHGLASRLACFKLDNPDLDTAEPALWFGKAPHAPVLNIRTESGREILATADHPFWTPNGMIEVERLQKDDAIALYPFEGVPYEEPPHEVIVDESSFRAFLHTLGKGKKGNAVGQIIQALKTRDLLPLTYDSPRLPYLIKLLGFVFGDGSLHFQSDGRGIVGCYGKQEDLELIRRDVSMLSFAPSQIYTRQRTHTIQTTYKEYTFDRTGVWFKVSSTALTALLAYLGAPVGGKAKQDYDAPYWLDRAPRWQKRLFLAALFGAELSSPQTVTGHGYNLAAPVLSMNKRESVVESGRRFLEQLSKWLSEFDVRVQSLQTREEQSNRDGSRSIRLRLAIAADPDNLIRLWSRVGYEYNRRRRFLAAVAVHYLRLKQQHISLRETIAAKARGLHEEGVSVGEIVTTLENSDVNKRFIERSVYSGRKTAPRVAQSFPLFTDFLDSVTKGLGKSGMIWDRISDIQEIDYSGLVYDFTMVHPDHNFVANGFVVSNCGVRLLASEMEEGAVRPYLDDLATMLYQHVPSGVGVGGFLKLSKKELNEVLGSGSRWALKKGYANHDDLLHTEEGGMLEAARADKVSDRAKERGRGQVGTLGAGNHFAEIDVVDEIFDVEAAAAYGLFEGQVTVLIHCGSRGLGHQVCTDYVQRFQGAVKRYGIVLPDRQLVCAPIQSPEGQDYLAAMAAAANFAWANRQLLTHQAREAFMKALAGKVKGWDLRLVYDIAHNMAKIETHEVNGEKVRVCVHRKGATRAFGPGNPALPPDYMDVGQPVLVPGSMGAASYVLAGAAGAMRHTFGSSCHGAGRQMSRKAAKRQVHGRELRDRLEAQGIAVRAGSLRGLAEEAPIAYKDVSQVVEIVHNAGIARKVARLRPIAVVKG